MQIIHIQTSKTEVLQLPSATKFKFFEYFDFFEKFELLNFEAVKPKLKSSQCFKNLCFKGEKREVASFRDRKNEYESMN